MHDIEPYYNWRDRYIAAEDERSPFYGREYSEFEYTHRIYNYLIHPQWDEFGSPTLYMKVLFADYDDGYAIIELIGEWNDCIQNDIESLKRNVADLMMDEGISRFVLICENVLNFHGSDDCYYEEWYEEVTERHGWIALVNTLRHVESEIRDTGLSCFLDLGGPFNTVNWRNSKPKAVVKFIELYHDKTVRVLP